MARTETERREVSENSLEALENTKQSTQDVYFILPSSVPCYHVTSLLIKGEACYPVTRQQVTEKERMRSRESHLETLKETEPPASP